MKKIFTPLLLLITVIVALPVINGIIMEKAVGRVLGNLNTMYKDSGTGYSVELLDYRRGLYSSKIDWKIHLGELKSLYGISEILVTDHAEHGLTGVVSTTDLESNPWFTSFITDKLQGSNPFSIVTGYSLFGKIESTCATTPFSFTYDNETFNIKEGRFILTTDRELKKFITSGTWMGLSVGDKLVFKNASLNADMEMHSPFIWDGTSSINFANFGLKEGIHHLEILDMDFKYDTDFSRDSNKLSSQSSISIKSAKTGESAIDGIAGKLAVKNMDAQGYEDFMKQYIAIVSSALSAAAEAGDTPEQMNEELEQQMVSAGLQFIAAFEKLLTRDLEIRLSDVLIRFKEGDLTADITLKLLKDMTLMRFAPVVGQPNLLFDIIYLSSELKLPAELVGENPMLLTPIYPGMQTGMFIANGETLSHKAETKDGKLIINGKEVNLAQQ